MLPIGSSSAVHWAQRVRDVAAHNASECGDSPGEVQGVPPAQNVDPVVSGGSASAAAARASVGVSVARSGNVTLSLSQASFGIIVLTNALTANINVVFPAGNRSYLINNAPGAYTITYVDAAGGGAGYIVRQGFT